ncbi:prepilin peptidase [Streptococcus thermophilus]|uniref:prepilin peptidase n=2 Tax=Streptococcus thermophilus TaxID=1308 RepID=UPI001C648792|nr:A24 family peptidase [Streptococcus thermophilus]MBW7820624.1 prepilin peptidase [Streptococcus thermophilus]
MLSILYFFLGTSLGSFIGLICDRFPEKSIIFPRSHCNQCGHPLRFFEMIPILSQLFLRFKCRLCQSSIPYRYLFLELFCGGILLLYFYNYLDFGRTYLLFFSLCLTIFDLKNKSYPLLFWILGTLPLLCLGNHYLTFSLGISLAVLSYIKRLNIGEGDFLYLASVSLIFPFSKILIAIELACSFGLMYFLVRKNPNETVAFVPFLFFSVLFVSFM